MEKNRFPHILTNSTNSVAVYTVLCILRRMRETLGLEAMLEYMESYLSAIDENNEELRDAVIRAISMMSVEKMYREGMR